MGAQTQDARSARAWELARRQHWVVTRRDLLALGFPPKAIRHRVQRGRLHAVRRGVYAVGRAELSREGRWMAAILACGEGALLSHRSAAALWGIAREVPGRIEVTIRRRSDLRQAGIRVHCRVALAAEATSERLGIPLTSPTQTLVDLAAELPPRRLERAVNEADKLGLVDPETLRAALDRHAGQAGVRPLRALLDRDTFLLSDQELEVLFRPLALQSGLPLPLAKHRVNGFEVDFFWPGLGLVVETDGLRYHRTPSAQSRDAVRDQVHTAAGLTTLRFSHHQVKYDPDHVRAILARTAARLQPGAARPSQGAFAPSEGERRTGSRT